LEVKLCVIPVYLAKIQGMWNIGAGTRMAPVLTAATAQRISNWETPDPTAMELHPRLMGTAPFTVMGATARNSVIRLLATDPYHPLHSVARDLKST
jgi:hypothetical protein